MDREILLEEERGEAKAGRQKDRHVTARHTQTDRQQVFVRCIAMIGLCNI